MEDRLQSKRCAKVLGALAAPERLRIIQFLTEGPHNVTEIAAMLGAPIVNVSHHLAVLRHAGLIEGSKQGRWVVYALVPGLLTNDDAEHTEHLDLGCCQIQIPPRTESGSPD